MSHNELNELEQLDGLAAELTEAGHLARIATAARERPEPTFAMRLRAELMRDQLERRSAVDVAPAEGLVANVPMPPARPLDLPGRFVERRHGHRPFIGPERSEWAAESEFGSLEVIFATQPDGVDASGADKRWLASDVPASPRRSYAALGLLPDQPGQEAQETGRPTALEPSMRWHIPTRVLPSRWLGIGLAASVAIASLIYGNGMFSSIRAVATADDAASAALIRGGASSVLTAGMALQEGDEIRVAATGRATLQLGGSYVRMAGGSDVQLRSLDPNHVLVNQITGRVYHRVAVPAGGDYQVATATVLWRAVGTAFDLDRHLTSGGGEQVQGLAIYDGVGVTGPQLQATPS